MTKLANSQSAENVRYAMPTSFQAGVYSGVLHYLKSVAAAGVDDGPAVARKMRELPVNDLFARGGLVGADGKMVHDIYLVEVKRPEEQASPWDLYSIRGVIPGEQAFEPMATGSCPLVTKQ